MPSSLRRLGSALQLVIPTVFLLASGFLCSAAAQTAPQLLPYTARLVAGGGTQAIAAGATCPASGNMSTDAFGDGCLATEVKLNAPRFVVTDKTGAIFLADSGNGIVRRIDPLTGIITLVAGGAAASPAVGSSCGAGVSTSSDGDGCPANLVKLSKPEGLAFTSNGDLYFADNGYDNVRRIAATAGVITTTGIISHIAGNTTYGYNVNNTSATPVVAATSSYLNFPYGIAFDKSDNLYISDEGNNALEVINLSATTQTIQGMSVPAGTIAKFAGYGNLNTKNATSGDCPDFTAAVTGSRGGCYFGKWTDGNPANTSNIDGNYDIAVDSNGNVFFANEFNDNVGKITAANVLTNYAGIQGTKGTALKRGPAGTFGIGSDFNVTLDSAGNLYTSDAVTGVVWRVDAVGQSMYPIAGGASSTCAGATDAYGDGCPATQANFAIGTLNASGFATAPGVAGLSVDLYGSLYVTDATNSLLRVVSSGANFGNIGAPQQTDTLDIHFVSGDSPASNAYAITAGATMFSLGSATCAVNSDGTTDCLLPITATPSALGAFTGTLQVTSTQGAVATFPLAGNYVQSPVTRTALSVNAGASCFGNTSYVANAPVTLTATVGSAGVATGTVTFFSNGTQIGAPQTIAKNVATLTYSFPAVGTYTVTANYSGDTYYNASTASASVTAVAPAFSTAAITYTQSTVAAGQTALYSFNVASTYTGSINFTCSGLPANASCSFSPVSFSPASCTASNTVAMSILTQQASPVFIEALGGGGHGPWQMLSLAIGLGSALLVGIRRRRSAVRFGRLWMVAALLLASSAVIACGKATPPASPTPSGSYTVMVTATGSTGATSSFTVPLVIR